MADFSSFSFVIHHPSIRRPSSWSPWLTLRGYKPFLTRSATRKKEIPWRWVLAPPPPAQETTPVGAALTAIPLTAIEHTPYLIALSDPAAIGEAEEASWEEEPTGLRIIRVGSR
ncbi:hypothetical protein AMTR_s00105p00134560 [Amborella trichopoda]|uniref:Uncharacterized protein n=1 Tax=Amborella trichopoda TaxID=13333 RepID=W1NXS7_AMBTC|nr:hypothetical protein AMTR_s00105p00134560 [Amborella trichopoda]